MENIKTSKKASPRSKKTMTLLSALEAVVTASDQSQLDDGLFVECKKELRFLSESYDITPVQAIFFAICLERVPRNLDFDDLACHLGFKNIRILTYASDIDALVRRRLLRYSDKKDEDMFSVPAAVIKSLKHNEIYQVPQRKGLDGNELMEYLNMWFGDLDDGAVSVQEMQEEITALFDENPQVAFVQKIKTLDLTDEERMMLVFFCHKLVNDDDDCIMLHELEFLFDKKKVFTRVKTEMRCGEHELMQRKLIEFICEDGMAISNHFKLTETAKRDLLSEFNVRTTDENLVDVLNPDKLTAKELYYSGNVAHQVDELASLLMPEEYQRVQERMRERGFRHGFTSLFHGGPGTGKTETVYQLARRTGRQIMVVDVPKIKSKWVGESEKNIKSLFDRYRALVSRKEIAPILLFNEADAIIGIRKQGAQNAVDKMENTIQNIILQEMETLDGILIATANLTENLDGAFERRFLYKIYFDKPDAAVRQKIWCQMIPGLEAKDVDILAEKYDFSGGQIENIARKYAVSCILHGDAADPRATLDELCRNEKISSNTGSKKIGF